MKQNGCSVSEYYTRMRGIWEELDAMSDLPRITIVAEEVVNFLQALAKQQQEQKLFQILNGLDEDYSAKRSQVLFMHSLPFVESVCAMLQQEELQREVLSRNAVPIESAALLSKGADGAHCTVCGDRGHTKEKCWQVMGYPNWHPKSRKFP